jgi:hypothetical protein
MLTTEVLTREVYRMCGPIASEVLTSRKVLQPAFLKFRNPSEPWVPGGGSSNAGEGSLNDFGWSGKGVGMILELASRGAAGIFLE